MTAYPVFGIAPLKMTINVHVWNIGSLAHPREPWDGGVRSRLHLGSTPGVRNSVEPTIISTGSEVEWRVQLASQ